MGIYRTQRSGGAVTPRCFWDRKGNHEKAGHWNFSPCGCGEDHLIRGDAVHLRHTEAAGAGGPPGRLSGHGGAGAGAGHHHFFQAGGAAAAQCRGHPAGHPGPCGLLQRDGAYPPGAGLCHPGHQRDGRGAGAHPDPVAAAGALSHPHPPLCQQDGPGGGGPGGSDGRAPEAGQRLRGLRPGGTRAPGERGHVRRGNAGAISGAGAGGAGGDPGPGGGAQAVSLLVRLRPEAGGGGGVPGGGGAVCPPEVLSPGVRGPGVQGRPGRPRGPADLPEDHRGQPAGENAPDRRGGGDALGRKSGPDPDLLRGQIPGRGGGGGGDRLRCNRAEPHQAGRGAGL